MKRRKLLNIIERIRRERPEIAEPEALLRAGVFVGGVRVDNPRALVPADAPLAFSAPKELRGTRKLRAALAGFGLTVAGRVALDVGASAGGFTAALLEAGAARVYAVDAGYGQLLGRLRADPRVVNLERHNLGALSRALIPDAIAVVTLDLSYLAIARAAPQLDAVRFAAEVDLVALVKPMFELGRGAAPSDEASLAAALTAASEGLVACGWRLAGAMRSPVTGARGAPELLVHARRG
jgi:23S rRNA (cytidine1920-2'-O)/16S rRNA (cytidine1409-2'-O)-methyltransferase